MPCTHPYLPCPSPPLKLSPLLPLPPQPPAGGDAGRPGVRARPQRAHHRAGPAVLLGQLPGCVWSVGCGVGHDCIGVEEAFVWSSAPGCVPGSRRANGRGDIRALNPPPRSRSLQTAPWWARAARCTSSTRGCAWRRRASPTPCTTPTSPPVRCAAALRVACVCRAYHSRIQCHPGPAPHCSCPSTSCCSCAAPWGGLQPHPRVRVLQSAAAAAAVTPQQAGSA